jgi:hypothetical protein
MSSPTKQSTKAVTLEDLLRLKRAERPVAEFWSQFEEALRAKQLAAIVERRPWWRIEFRGLTAGLARLRVPVGLAAVAVLSFVTVQQFRAPTNLTSEAPVDGAGVAAVSVSGGTVVAVTTPELNAVNAAVEAAGDAENAAAPALASSSVRSSAGAAVTSLSLADATTSSVLDQSDALATAGLASNLRALRGSGFAGLDSTGVATLELGTLRSSPRAASVEEPLARVTAPTESRRERLAALVAPASMKSLSSAGSPDRVRERMISRLSEDELYNSVSRLGVERGGLRVSF